MQALLEAGIEDLGGTGELILEIEYNNAKGFKEAFYRLPNECDRKDITHAMLLHFGIHTTLTIEFNGIEPFDIALNDICEELIEVRLENAVGGPNITHIFSEC